MLFPGKIVACRKPLQSSSSPTAFQKFAKSSAGKAPLFADSPATRTDELHCLNRTQLSLNLQFQAVEWSPRLGLFLAIDSSGNPATSTNGTNWQLGSNIVAAALIPVWSEDQRQFVLVRQSANATYVSTDGKVFTQVGATAARTWVDVCWSPQLKIFCTIALGGAAAGQVYTCARPQIGWTAQTSAEGLNWTGICWSPALRLFCAVSSSTGVGTACMISSDGVTWSQPASFTGTATSVAWAEELGMFVAAGSSGQVKYSYDGVNWTSIVVVAANSWRRVTYAPERRMFVLTSNTGTVAETALATSFDGKSWKIHAAPAATGWTAVTWSPKLGILVGLSATFNNFGKLFIGY